MIERLELKKRFEFDRELSFEEVDDNWVKIENAINNMMLGQWQQDFEGVVEGELEVVHDIGLLPKMVAVWQKVTADRWIPVATPDVSYKDESLSAKLYINFPFAPGSIKVMIKF